ncbi:MAG TPA: tetratricopeptide repeat protein [Verrucomicrobiae bacterium]
MNPIAPLPQSTIRKTRAPGWKQPRFSCDGLRSVAAGLFAGVALAVLTTGCSPHGSRSEAVAETSPDVATIQTRAAQGEATAQRQLGALYAEGHRMKQDYAEAAKWYRRAAEQGEAGAQTALGELHEAGQGVARDEAEAARWYRLAAEQGYAPAQYNLAVLYAVGRGVPLDQREALRWYERAAEQGDPLAQYNLGMRYLEGKGVSPDRVAAWKWLTLAAEGAAGGLEDARKARQTLVSRLTATERSEAEKQVREFRQRPRPPQARPR